MLLSGVVWLACLSVPASAGSFSIGFSYVGGDWDWGRRVWYSYYDCAPRTYVYRSYSPVVFRDCGPDVVVYRRAPVVRYYEDCYPRSRIVYRDCGPTYRYSYSRSYARSWAPTVRYYHSPGYSYRAHADFRHYRAGRDCDAPPGTHFRYRR